MDGRTGGRESIPNCCQTSDVPSTPRGCILDMILSLIKVIRVIMHAISLFFSKFLIFLDIDHDLISDSELGMSCFLGARVIVSGCTAGWSHVVDDKTRDELLSRGQSHRRWV